MRQETEIKGSAIMNLALSELSWKVQKINKDRMIEVNYEPAVDLKGNPFQKLHRTRITNDK